MLAQVFSADDVITVNTVVWMTEPFKQNPDLMDMLITVMPIFQKFSEIRKSKNSAENFPKFESMKIRPKISEYTWFDGHSLNLQIC